jgi:hypothetical protein
MTPLLMRKGEKMHASKLKMSAVDRKKLDRQERVGDRFAPSKFTPQEAFEVYQALPDKNRTALAHAEAMAKAGKPVGHATLAKWRKKYNWDARLSLTGAPNTGYEDNVFRSLQNTADKFPSKALRGIVGQLMTRVQLAIPTLPCSSIGEAKDIISLADSVQALHERIQPGWRRLHANCETNPS